MKQKAEVEVQKGSCTEEGVVISVAEDNSVFANLAATLTEIRKLKGVTGYILRNSNAAIVDVTPKKFLTEYAILSSQIQEAASAISKPFNLADVESVLVEGKNVKVLCMSIGDNRLGIFMEKSCGHTWIVKRILL
ncbi:MAG: roadblock/LC7 domain-containing protein [Candidatus Bathyarchaeia archaeon]